MENQFEILCFKNDEKFTLSLGLKGSNIVTSAIDICAKEFLNWFPNNPRIISYKKRIFTVGYAKISNLEFYKINENLKIEPVKIFYDQDEIIPIWLPDIDYFYDSRDLIYIYKFEVNFFKFVKKFQIKKLLGSSKRFIVFVNDDNEIICYDPSNDSCIKLLQYDLYNNYHVFEQNIMRIYGKEMKYMKITDSTSIVCNNKIQSKIYSDDIFYIDEKGEYYYLDEKNIFSHGKPIHAIENELLKKFNIKYDQAYGANCPYPEELLTKYKNELLIHLNESVVNYIILPYL